jgi:hypothetical protein
LPFPDAPSDFRADRAEKVLSILLASNDGVAPPELEPPEVVVPLLLPDAAAVEVADAPPPEVELLLLLLLELPHAATRAATATMGTMARNLPAMQILLAMGRRPLDTPSGFSPVRR